MKDIEFIKITKEEFEKLDEKNLIFITNPGRMGDTDGSNFIVKIGNVFYPYRVSNWMYSTDEAEITWKNFLRSFLYGWICGIKQMKMKMKSINIFIWDSVMDLV